MPNHTDLTATEDGIAELVDHVVIARPRRELYAFWRDFTNLPKFMHHVQSVTEIDSLSSVWTINAAGHSAEWEFIVTDDERDRLIAWAASGKTASRYAGRVEFEDARPNAGTEVTLTLRYGPPSRILESFIAKLSGTQSIAEDLRAQTRADLTRLKRYMEGC
jgi:uncharacterized membrane protein